MFDLTVFDLGHRGDIDHVVEVLEYHGPFHYTENEVTEKGSLPATLGKIIKLLSKKASI